MVQAQLFCTISQRIKMTEQAVRGISGYDVTGYRDYRGVEVFGAWLWDNKLEMGLATEINKDEALSSYIQTRNIFASVVIFALVIGYVVLRIIFNLLSKSARKIQEDKHILAAKVAERTRELLETQDDLSRANHELQVLATTDELTMLANRRRFDQVVAEQWQRSRRQRTSIAILMIDVDYFKQFNDTYGHIEGDRCLRKIAQAVKKVYQRDSDLVARFGGEELVVISIGNDEAETKKRAKKLRASIEQLDIPAHSSEFKVVTASVGYVTESKNYRFDGLELINFADRAMYIAKGEGRNRVFGGSVNFLDKRKIV